MACPSIGENRIETFAFAESGELADPHCPIPIRYLAPKSVDKVLNLIIPGRRQRRAKSYTSLVRRYRAFLQALEFDIVCMERGCL
jgi:hypothetical protein